ncbi:MAG: alpha/beta hydrolase [Holophagaceae bacterium]
MPIPYAYGPAPSQVADLHLPDARPAGIVALFHGGFWRFPYGSDQMDDLAADLVRRGYAVWNVEYRRVGEPGGGWPGTVADAFAALDFLADPALASHGLDLSKVVAAGHSAGGHLALLTALGERPSPFAPRHPRVRSRAVASLAGIPDLARVHALGSGNGAVAGLLGGAPEDLPERV